MKTTSSPTQSLIRKIDFSRASASDRQQLLYRQWLLTNGLGGYASGTISAADTWRYHGLLIAALPAPLGRMLMLNHLAEFVQQEDGRVVQIGGDEPQQPGESLTGEYLTEFRLEN